MSRAGVMAGLLSLGLGSLVGATARAEDNVPADRQPSSFGDPSESETTVGSFSVESVDRPGRVLVVQSADGSRMTVRVAPEVTGLDELRKGDRIELDYYPATVLAFGDGDGRIPRFEQTPTRASAPPLGPAAAQVMTVRARVSAVDRDDGTLQITTPSGEPQTLLVREPAERRQLRSLRPGDTVVVTYPQPVAVGLRSDGST
jgi:hypothetical protein